MKYSFKLFGAALLVVLASCNNKPKVVPGTYVDLNTGESVDVIADPVTGYAINSKTNKPVYLYVASTDTIFTTGLVVNDKLILLPDGNYEVDETKIKVDDLNVKIKYEAPETINNDGDYKIKVDGDEVKIKDGDTKIKIEDGEVKKVKK